MNELGLKWIKGFLGGTIDLPFLYLRNRTVYDINAFIFPAKDSNNRTKLVRCSISTSAISYDPKTYFDAINQTNSNESFWKRTLLFVTVVEAFSNIPD